MIILADKLGRSDGVAIKLCEQIKTDLPILLVSRVDGLVFNDEILQLSGNPYILIDFIEMGWDWDFRSHKWGENTSSFDFMNFDGYLKLSEFIKQSPPKVSFIRELLLSDVKENVHPISYPCLLPTEPLQSREQFDKRKIQTIFSWGLSHEYRKELHAKIWSQSGKHGYAVCDNLHYLAAFAQYELNPNKWLTINIPWYSRMGMQDFIKINGFAKISVSIAGAGTRCFRHSESPVNSVMMLWDDGIAWSSGMEWEHNVNCIKCKPGDEIECILEGLNNPNLYDIYCAGVENVDRYRVERYCTEYIEPRIKNPFHE